MHARVTMVQSQPGQQAELVRIYQESVVPAAQRQEGFKGALLLTEQGGRMAYLIWPLIGIVVAMLVGVRVLRPSTRAAPRTPFLAGAFGGFVGGVIGDGLPHVQGIALNLPSIIGAVLGALLLCLAVGDRASDAEQ